MPVQATHALRTLLVLLACAGLAACAGPVGEPNDAGEASGAPGQASVAPSAGRTGDAGGTARESTDVPLLEALEARGATTMVRLVRAAGLEDRLSDRCAAFTLVAPDDDAFAAFAPQELDRILGRRERAAAFVLDHTLPGRVPPQGLRDGLLTETMYKPAGLQEAGHLLSWTVRDGALGVEGAAVTVVVEAADGLAYVVDRPLPAAPEAWARPARASPGQRATVFCRWVEADGTPVAGARCNFGWHFGGLTRHDEALTDARGVARCTRVVPSGAADGRTLVTVTTYGSAPTRTVVAAFVVR